jgi:prepilin-type N-terminal cleavage/methylation domain-containing protein
MSRRPDKGFTLIELLVVIAIIALLMSILMPALRNVRDQAKNSICMQRLQQWGVMFNIYSGEYDGKLMGWNEYAWYGGEFVEHAWVPMMYDYAEGFEVYLCPAATELWSYGERFDSPKAAWDFRFMAEEFTIGEWWPYYNVGTQDNPIYAYGSYGKNEWVTDVGEYHERELCFPNIRVKSVFEIPLLGCSDFMAGFPYARDEAPETRLHDPVGEARWCVDRHALSINLLFLDWSVRKVGLRQLWQLRWNREKESDGSSSWGNPAVVPDPKDATQWPEWLRNSQIYDL